MQNKYVPTVLVAGDVEEFRARIGNKPAKVVGNVSFSGEFNGRAYSLIKNQTLFLNGELVNIEVLKKMVETAEFDYIVFTDYMNFGPHSIYLANNLLSITRILMVDTFIYNLKSGFYSFYNEYNLYGFCQSQEITTLLDFDSFFANGMVYVKPSHADNLKIDGICDDYNKNFPISVNVYDNLYNSISDCCLRHYDAVILTAERDWRDLQLAINETLKLTEKFILFVRSRSQLNEIFTMSSVQRS